MLIQNARVYTLDHDGGTTEAVALQRGAVAATGSAKELRARFPHERVIDAGGRALLPGFVDAHAHLSNLARAKLGLDLSGAASLDEAAVMVGKAAAALPPGEWISGRGWDQNRWGMRELPDRAALDRAAPAHPVALTRVDSHATWANTAALQAAGLDRDTPDPSGGLVLRGLDGELSGILIDRAQRLLWAAIPPPSEQRLLVAIREAIADCLAVGLTGVQEMGLDASTLELYKRLIDRAEFPFRVYGAVGGRGQTWEQYRRQGPLHAYGGRLTVRSLKLVSDGALGSRGAALLEPYSDDPGNCGLMIIPEAEIAELCEQAIAAGFQVCTHAIGDRANREVLNAYERALSRQPPFDHRFRVEHAQILTASDLPRFKQLNVLPSMQATHCTSDMPWAETRLGVERLRSAYAWRSLLDTGVPVLGGSDFPVESPNPFLGLYASVTRQQPGGHPPGGWSPEQRMTRREAVLSFTRWAAYGAFEESVRGRIAPGYAADLVLLSDDPFTVDEETLPSVTPLLTLVGGEIVYQSPAWSG